MSRRANLPGAAELFRVTQPVEAAQPRPVEVAAPRPTAPAPAVESPARESPDAEEVAEGEPSVAEPVPLRRAASARAAGPPAAAASAKRQPSGRERHDEKITVYISPEELHDLEHARLLLRREYGVRADRGRIVRAALAVVLSDLEAHGEQSELVRRFRQP